MSQQTQPDSEFLGKYESTGRIGQLLINRFFSAGQKLLSPHLKLNDSVLEVGCGPGYSTRKIAQWKPGVRLVGGDLSASLLEHAQRLNSDTRFLRESVYSLPHPDKSIDVALLLEVLEHLERPDAALVELQRVVRRRLLLSTPREPLWRMLNFTRGKYLSQFGNTPGHIQHWSTRSLIRQVSPYFRVEAVATPIPWTILLLAPK
ncbi:MAG: methyltransferase domain-containing protein [Xanthomonadales bacterium]|nr:methyltransferase domain-containing protein [Xanthomonadales bacterium]